jgi:hypothetical protein
MNLGWVLSKLVQKNLNYTIPRDGDGESFNKKPNHTSKLRCTLLSYTLHPTELSWTLPSYAAPSRATLHFWATLHPFELRCTLRSYTAPYWAIIEVERTKKKIQ